MRKVTIIGAGPGNPDLLSRAALDAIDIADVVIGAHRALVGIDVPPDVVRCELVKTADIVAALTDAASWQRAVVGMTGDVGLFSGARRLVEALSGGAQVDVRIIPGISSASYLAARLARPWQDWRFASAHGVACDIVAEAERYVAAGVKEITLLGQNVNSYGRDLYGEPRFADVLRAVDAAGIERLRFATSHPKDLTDEVIGLFATLPSLMPALHLPVQSGSNRILSAMNRRYTREHYLGLIEKLRRARPDIALSTDIIVGFPGETEEDFMDTYRLVEEVGYSQVFTFIYSKREGTPAAEMDDDTPREVIQERFDRLVDLGQRKAFEANQAELGATVPVLVEGTSKRDDSILAGKSPKNQTVHAPVPAGADATSLVGRIVPVTIEEARTWHLSGTIVHA